MHLIFIHGPVASGKLTVARELARLTGFGLFHNHLIVDALTPVFAFGSEPFTVLREQIWLSVFNEAARHDVSLIFTFAPERTVRTSFVQAVRDGVESAGGEVLFVGLTCPFDEIERRVQDPSRAEFGKLQSPDVLRDLAGAGALSYAAQIPSPLTIDTSVTRPSEAAERICAFFGLQRSAAISEGA
jgi:hypothetical protein